jgi:hypothetical protein
MVQVTDRNMQSGQYKNSVSYIKIKVVPNGIYADKVKDWFSHCFVPEAKKCFFAENNLTFNTVLNVDNIPYHPHILYYYHLNIKVNFTHISATRLCEISGIGCGVVVVVALL